MDTRRNRLDRETILRAIDTASELDILTPKRAAAARRLLEHEISAYKIETIALRATGLLSSQLRALARIAQPAATTGEKRSDLLATELVPDGENPIAVPAPARPDSETPHSSSRHGAARVDPRWVAAAAALFFFAFWLPLVLRKPEETGAAPDAGPAHSERWQTLDQDLARRRSEPTEIGHVAPQVHKILLPTDEEVIAALVEDAACMAPDGSHASWTVDPAGPLQLTVWTDGKLTVIEGDKPQADPLMIPGGECKVRRVVRTPWGRGVLLLVEDVGVDSSSRIFLFDPYDRRFDLVFDSSNRALLQDALRRDGKERYADNDLTEVFFTREGEIAFTTEDNDTLVTHLEEGRVVRLDAVHRVSPFRDTSVTPRGASNGKAFFTVLYK